MQTLVVTSGVILALIILALACLKGWEGWLTLKSREMDFARPDADTRYISTAGRIELADLKERIRALEAIAAGVDLA